MATVFLARDLRHDRHVALKVLNPDLAAALGAERFLAEIRTTANLQHPHILPLHDSGEADGHLFYVMPFVEGETLRGRLERRRHLRHSPRDGFDADADRDDAGVRVAARQPAISPNGRWLAYASNESGRNEVYVVPFPNAKSARWMVSSHGGSEPLWAHNGKELFYRDATDNLVGVEIEPNRSTSTLGAVHALFSVANYYTYPGHRSYDIMPDDQRFVMLSTMTAQRDQQVVITLNWAGQLAGTAAARERCSNVSHRCHRCPITRASSCSKFATTVT